VLTAAIAAAGLAIAGTVSVVLVYRICDRFAVTVVGLLFVPVRFVGALVLHALIMVGHFAGGGRNVRSNSTYSESGNGPDQARRPAGPAVRGGFVGAVVP
jgi:hypothetical protein